MNSSCRLYGGQEGRRNFNGLRAISTDLYSTVKTNS